MKTYSVHVCNTDVTFQVLRIRHSEIKRLRNHNRGHHKQNRCKAKVIIVEKQTI